MQLRLRSTYNSVYYIDPNGTDSEHNIIRQFELWLKGVEHRYNVILASGIDKHGDKCFTHVFQPLGLLFQEERILVKEMRGISPNKIRIMAADVALSITPSRLCHLIYDIMDITIEKEAWF